MSKMCLQNFIQFRSENSEKNVFSNINLKHVFFENGIIECSEILYTHFLQHLWLHGVAGFRKSEKKIFRSIFRGLVYESYNICVKKSNYGFYKTSTHYPPPDSRSCILFSCASASSHIINYHNQVLTSVKLARTVRFET